MPVPAVDAAAATEQADCSASRRVRLRLVPGLPAALGRELVIDLRTELGRRGIAVCEEPASDSETPLAAEAAAPDAQRASHDGHALATVQVTLIGKQRARIDVQDHLTRKEVARSVDLAKLPSDGHALALALAIDELLRASWAELSWSSDGPSTLRPAFYDVPPAPPPRSPATGSRYRASWLATITGIGRDLRAPGALLGADVDPWRRLWLGARAGSTRMLRRSTAAGSVAGQTFSSALSLGVCRQPADAAWRGCLGAGPQLEVLWLRVDADAAHVAGRDHRAFILGARGVLQLSRRLARRLWLIGELSVGSTVFGARLTDGSSALLELEGWSNTASLGLGVTP